MEAVESDAAVRRQYLHLYHHERTRVPEDLGPQDPLGAAVRRGWLWWRVRSGISDRVGAQHEPPAGVTRPTSIGHLSASSLDAVWNATGCELHARSGRTGICRGLQTVTGPDAGCQLDKR
jgi:hypothetical protein